MWKKENSYFE